MILMMTRTVAAKQFQLLSIAHTCGVDCFEPQESTPYDSHVIVKVEGGFENNKNLLKELQFRFGNSVWEVQDDT